MREHKKKILTILLLCFYLVSCVTNASSGLTATPIGVSTQELNIQVTKVSFEKLYEWKYLNQYTDNIRWAPNNSQFAVSFFDTVKMFDVNALQEVYDVPSASPAYNASAPVFSPSGHLLYLYIRLRGPQAYDSQTGMLLAETSPDYQSSCFLNNANGSMISMDGKILFTIVEDDRKKQVDFMEIQRWDVSSLQCSVFARIEGHSRSIDISSDGKYLLASTGKGSSISRDSLSEDGEIIVWNIETNEQVCVIKNKGSFVRFKPLESRLLVADPIVGKLSYWDITMCSIVQEIEGVITYYDFVFSPDGKMIALWDGSSISILHAGSGELIQKINDSSLENTPMNYMQSHLSFSHDGRLLLSVLNRDPLESLIILWSIKK